MFGMVQLLPDLSPDLSPPRHPIGGEDWVCHLVRLAPKHRLSQRLRRSTELRSRHTAGDPRVRNRSTLERPPHIYSPFESAPDPRVVSAFRGYDGPRTTAACPARTRAERLLRSNARRHRSSARGCPLAGPHWALLCHVGRTFRSRSPRATEGSAARRLGRGIAGAWIAPSFADAVLIGSRLAATMSSLDSGMCLHAMMSAQPSSSSSSSSSRERERERERSSIVQVLWTQLCCAAPPDPRRACGERDRRRGCFSSCNTIEHGCGRRGGLRRPRGASARIRTGHADLGVARSRRR